MEKLSISYSFGGALGCDGLSFEDLRKRYEDACAEAAEWLNVTP